MANIQLRQAKWRATWIFWVALGFCGILFSGPRAWCQLDQGTITGVVQDSSGAVIPGAEVALTNTDTGLALQRKANGSGIYVFSPVKIGNYSVSATAPGFQTTSQEHLHLDVQERLNVVLVLKPGAVSQTVTVSTAPPLLQTQSGSVGQVVSTRTINNTALVGRNWVDIAQLTSGVTPTLGGSRGSGTGDFFANGQRAEQNNFILDGVDNNVNIIDFMNGTSYNVRPPPDALAEFKVQTADYSAEFGHSAGAVLNASIKSGTNQIHGDVWEYARNTVLDAKDWNALTIPPYSNNQFGATLGFPILRNKLFYFGDAEANRISFGDTHVITVPTSLMRQGNFSELLNTGLTGSAQPIQLYQPNSGGGTNGTAKLSCNGQSNVLCASQIDPVAQNILNLYPLPNANGGKTYQNYVENLNDTSDTWQWDQRVDWNISPKDQTYVRYSYKHVQNTNTAPLGPILDGTGSYAGKDQNYLSENGMGSETHIFNPNVTNEFRFSFNWGAFANLQENYNVNVSAKLGLGGIPFGPGFQDNGGLPQVGVGGIASFGSHYFDPSVEHQNIYQILDNVTTIIGNHSLKFGLDLQSIRVAFLQPYNSRGNYSFSGFLTSYPQSKYPSGSGMADFLTDQVASAGIGNEPTINDTRWYRSAYAQDDWRATSKLTLNFGVRYDYYQPYKEQAGRQSNFIVTPPYGGVGTGTAIYQIPTQSRNITLPAAFTSLLAMDNVTIQYVNNPYLVTAQKLNFAPRLGFAYQLDARTVIHGGFGIFYGGLENVGNGPNLGGNYPFATEAGFVRPNCAPNNCPSAGLTLENGFSQALAVGLQNFIALPGFAGSDPHIKTPYTTDYNLAFEHALSNNLVANIGYVGNVARHLVQTVDPNDSDALLNPANQTQFVRPFPDLSAGTQDSYEGQSMYNSLQTKLQKRYANGLNFLATYTWSHALDDSGSPLGGGVGSRNTNLIPLIDEYTNSAFDIRNRFTFNGFYELPFGRGRAHMNHGGWTNFVAGGWATSLTFVAQSGSPFTVSPNIKTAAGGNARAIPTRDPFSPGGSPDPTNPNVTCAVHTHTHLNFYNPCAFANPPLPGNNIPRTGPGSQVTGLSPQGYAAYLGGKSNFIYGPGYERINMSLFKDFPTWHSQYLEFRADIFNVFNHPSLSICNSSINSNGGLVCGTKSLQQNTPDARFFQLSVKYAF